MSPNPSNDIACIALERRTSSSCTAVLLISDSPRVCPASYLKENKLCPYVDNKSVWEGVSPNGNSWGAVTTAMGVVNNDGSTDAATAKASKALENHILFPKKSGGCLVETFIVQNVVQNGMMVGMERGWGNTDSSSKTIFSEPHFTKAENSGGW
ncbi:hypothetical protein MHU86_126 [Fragilaria crotonensis]|nr:hypothetical protein MHU86_126 [Fragilaria crotonensis]